MSKVDQSCLQRRTKGSNFLSGSHFMRDPSAADIFCSDSYFRETQKSLHNQHHGHDYE